MASKTKTVVIYDSLTGNTRKIAKRIADTLGCDPVFIDEVMENDFDLVVLGSPVHGFRPSKKVMSFIEGLKTRRLAVFCTYGAPLIGSFSAKGCLGYMKKHCDAEVVGEFSCPGFHDGLKTFRGRPDDDDLKHAEEFAEGLEKA